MINTPAASHSIIIPEMPIDSNDSRPACDVGINLSALSPDGKVLASVIINYFEKLLHKQERQHEAEISHLTKRLQAMEEKHDSLENYTRRDTLVITADPSFIASKENCTRTVCDIVSSKLGVALNQADISVAHPLPDAKPRNGAEIKRRIIFKLVRREMKQLILRACLTKKPPFSINESISPTRSTILYVLRRARIDYPSKFGKCRTEDGNIKLWLPKVDNPEMLEKIDVSTRSKLEELLKVKANISSSKYNPRWLP